MLADNLYLHFPFCRAKCRYCALLSRVGKSDAARRAYVASLARQLSDYPSQGPLKTLYFGGGSPALTDLTPIFRVLDKRGLLTDDTEFTVELHPLDVTDNLLTTLRAGGVNRISMGLEALDDATLSHMGRGYTFDAAEIAFSKITPFFSNVGIDLIVGYPTESSENYTRTASIWKRLATWGLTHASVYSLILEEKTRLAHDVAAGRLALPDDDTTLNRLALVTEILSELGLSRYEISNYARTGFECRHNLAVWRGEDYTGLGEGAFGREGLERTTCDENLVINREKVSPETDRRERTLFRLRTRDGLDTAAFPEWRETLDRFVQEGLLTTEAPLIYRLTSRGTEVCDSILAELV